MKRLIIAVLFLAAFVSGGCTNSQRSSREEAMFVVRGLADFQSHIQYLSIKAVALGAADDPAINESDPSLSKHGKKFVHEVIYRTSQNSFKLVLLDDSRPPKVIAVKELK